MPIFCLLFFTGMLLFPLGIKADENQLAIDFKNSEATTSYDKFKDKTTIHTIIELGGHRLALGWGNNGNRLTKSQNMALIVSGDPVDSISFITDDQRFTLDLKDNGTALDSEILQKLYSANVIEIQIGDSQYKLKRGTNLYDPASPSFKQLHFFLDYFFQFPDNY